MQNEDSDKPLIKGGKIVVDFTPPTRADAAASFDAVMAGIKLDGKKTRQKFEFVFTADEQAEYMVKRMLKGSAFMNYDKVTSKGIPYSAAERAWYFDYVKRRLTQANEEECWTRFERASKEPEPALPEQTVQIGQWAVKLSLSEAGRLMIDLKTATGSMSLLFEEIDGKLAFFS